MITKKELRINNTPALTIQLRGPKGETWLHLKVQAHLKTILGWVAGVGVLVAGVVKIFSPYF